MCMLFVFDRFCVFSIANGDVGLIDCANLFVSSDSLVP
jgi:hypothetical protein